jgi:hypothetical protein
MDEEDVSDDDESENPNDNCLQGKKCPKCGSYGSFDVRCSMWQNVSDDGTDYPQDKTLGDVEYGGDSDARCYECHYEGKLREFDDPADDPPSAAPRRFNVTVVGTAHHIRVVEVDACTRSKACELALKRAGDLSFSLEKEAKYSVEAVLEA